MRHSFAKAHFLRTLASEQATTGDGDYVGGNAYELMLMQMHDHKRRLKEVQSTERKAEVKLEILPEYDAYIDGILAADAGGQDDVLMTVMVWRIDAGDIPGALVIGEYALRHQLKTPEQFRRDTATMLAEEVAEQALRIEGPAEVSQLLKAEEMTRDHDMPDEVRAKLHKAIAIALTDIAPAAALEHFDRAHQLHDKSGVKKMRESVQRTIKNAEPLTPEHPPATAETAEKEAATTATNPAE